VLPTTKRAAVAVTGWVQVIGAGAGSIRNVSALTQTFKTVSCTAEFCGP